MSPECAKVGVTGHGEAKRGPGERFGPTLASEHLNAEHGMRVPANTLRDWMLAAGLWSRVRRRKPAPRRRERRAHFGELVRGISEDEAANEFVRTLYLPQLNARFTVVPASPLDYHLPRDPGLADRDVFCLEHTRTVGSDYVVQFGRRTLQLSPSIRGRVPAGSKILVREDRAGNLRLVHVNRRGEEREYRWTDAARGPRAPTAVTKTTPNGEPQKPNRPSPEHPWRKRNALGVAHARIRRVALNGAS